MKRKPTVGSERLRRYLSAQRLSTIEFAGLVGANRSQVFRLVTDERSPSIKLAARIEKATGGKVRSVDWTVPAPSARKAPARVVARSTLNDKHAPQGT
jgi:transcriptional regulator with XRE-family HTH domain